MKQGNGEQGTGNKLFNEPKTASHVPRSTSHALGRRLAEIGLRLQRK